MVIYKLFLTLSFSLRANEHLREIQNRDFPMGFFSYRVSPFGT